MDSSTLMRFALFLLVLVLVPAAAAQSGYGGLSGIVLPENPTHADAPGTWTDEGLDDPDGVLDGSPELKLTPINAHLDPAPVLVRAEGLYGRYDFGRIPMGLYRLRVEAPGYEAWEAEIYIPSDGRAQVHILLHRKP